MINIGYMRKSGTLEKTPGSRNICWIIGLLALINVVLHLLFSFNLEYHRDELLYFSLGLHPAFGYATVPPLIGWVAWAMQGIFGYSLFAVRIFPAILSGLMIFLVSETAKELGGSFYARIVAGIGMMLSIFGLRTFLLFQPVHIDLILWTLFFYLTIRYVNTTSGKYLVLLGLTAGFALLNKYLIGLLFIVFVLVLPFTRYRIIFRNRYFWYGIIAGMLVFLPNLIWQAVNGLPVIQHFDELRRTQLVNVDQAAFMIEQLIIPGAASILTVAGIIFIFTGKAMSKLRFLGFVSLLVVVSLMLLRGKSYYTQGVMPLLLSAGAVFWESFLKAKWARIFLIIVIVVITIPVIPVGIPVYKTDRLKDYFGKAVQLWGMDFICRFEDNSIHSLPQDYADMLGWEELAAITDRTRHMITDKSAALIWSSWGNHDSRQEIRAS